MAQKIKLPRPGGPAPARTLNSPRERRLRRRINNFYVYRTIRKAIRDCHAEDSVLMAPCGHGWFFDRFRRDRIEVVGVDLAPDALENARTAVSPPMRVLQADIKQLPFADGQFEIVVSNRFLLHFEDEFRALAFKELARVTSRYVLVHYDVPALSEFTRKLRGYRRPEWDIEALQGWRKRKRSGRRLFFTKEQMAAEGAAAGLTVKKLYRVFPLLSARVYCLYEKAGAP